MYNERQKEMIKYLSEVKFARAEQLSERFQVSLETVRRDLMVLEQGSSIRKVRGGAVYSNLRAKEMEFEKKMENNQIYLSSGYLRKHNKSLVGGMCNECLGNFKVDKTILSIDGISIQDGVTEYNTEEAATLRKMLEIGHTKMILCEFSKFSEVAFNKVCGADRIDYVFTDWNIPAREARAWNDIGVKVLSSPQHQLSVLP